MTTLLSILLLCAPVRQIATEESLFYTPPDYAIVALPADTESLDPTERRNQRTCRRLGIEGEIVVVPLWVLNPNMATKLDVLIVPSK